MEEVIWAGEGGKIRGEEEQSTKEHDVLRPFLMDSGPLPISVLSSYICTCADSLCPLTQNCGARMSVPKKLAILRTCTIIVNEERSELGHSRMVTERSVPEI